MPRYDFSHRYDLAIVYHGTELTSYYDSGGRNEICKKCKCQIACAMDDKRSTSMQEDPGCTIVFANSGGVVAKPTNTRRYENSGILYYDPKDLDEILNADDIQRFCIYYFDKGGKKKEQGAGGGS